MSTAIQAASVDTLPEGEANRLAELESQICSAVVATHVAKHEIGLALREIRDARLYREKYRTFEAYLKEKWDLSKSFGYELIQYATEFETSAIADKPTSPGQAKANRQARNKAQQPKASATKPKKKGEQYFLRQKSEGRWQRPSPPVRETDIVFSTQEEMVAEMDRRNAAWKQARNGTHLDQEKGRIEVLLEVERGKGGGFPPWNLVSGVMYPLVDKGPQMMADLAKAMQPGWPNKQRVEVTLGGFEHITTLMLEQPAAIGQVKQLEDGKWTSGDKFQLGEPFQLFQTPDYSEHNFTIETKELRKAQDEAWRKRQAATLQEVARKEAQAESDDQLKTVSFVFGKETKTNEEWLDELKKLVTRVRTSVGEKRGEKILAMFSEHLTSLTFRL